MEVYTDGSCITGNDGRRYSGSGVWFGPNDIRNTSIPIMINEPTNQHAELNSILYALRYCKTVNDLIIMTDSKYSIDCITVWSKTWIVNGWRTSQGKDVLHSDIIKECIQITNERKENSLNTRFIYVKGHSTSIGNNGADELAKSAAKKSQSIAFENTLFFDKGYLDPFYICKFTSSQTDGATTYNCIEQWHHHQKALLFKDNSTAKKILEANTPFQQMALGRQVINFSQDIWASHRLDIAIRGNYYKFSQNSYLRSYLLSLKGKRLAKARNDSVWGIGITENESKTGHKWTGTNLLGIALMKVRDEYL